MQNNRFCPFHCGEIHPTGWLLNHMRIQADGLLGNMDRIYHDIRESLWTGGKSSNYDELSLWLQGFIPVAYALDDKEMKKRATFYIDRILENNQDQWVKTDPHFDLYSLVILLNTLIIYADAEQADLTGHVYTALQQLDKHLDCMPLSQSLHLNWFDVIPPILYVYQSRKEPWLQQLERKLECAGFDWIRFFSDGWPYEKEAVDSCFSQVTQNARALRAGAYLSRFYADNHYYEKACLIQARLEKYDTTCTGMFAGKTYLEPQSATESINLAALSEYMYSCAEMAKIEADVEYADKLEFLTYNPYAAAFSHDGWTFQTIQQPNQTSCKRQQNPADSSTSMCSGPFGIQSDDGQPAATFCKGLPAYVQNLYGKTETGIAIISYAPSVLETRINDCPVKIECISDYPFKENILIRVTTLAECRFDVELRIPKWADELKLSLGSQLYMPVKNSYFKFSGTWQGTTEIHLTIKSRFELKRTGSDLYAAVKGPILFAIPLTEDRIAKGTEPYAEAELQTPDHYAYAFEPEYRDLFARSVTYEEKQISAVPFSPSTPAVEMYTYGRRIHWPTQDASSTKKILPISASASGEMLRFIPYGSTNLRMTLLPILKK